MTLMFGFFCCSGGARTLPLASSRQRCDLGDAVKHFVAKLVKSFGGLCNAVESLDGFR